MKPNILFAFADDWGRYASAYAKYAKQPGSLNELIATPNFDRIAAEGALFLNALVPAPSCTPCRSSILAGQYFWQTGLGAFCKVPCGTRKSPRFRWNSKPKAATSSAISTRCGALGAR